MALRHTFTGLAAALLVATATIPNSRAQQYPTGPVKIVVPLAAGTGMDSLVRIYAEDLSKALGQAVVVENQPGATLMLAATAVARAAPDGHTLLIATVSSMAVNQTLYKQINYDPDKDLVPIALYVKSPFVLVVHPGAGIASLSEFMTKARESKADPLTYSTPGAGTLQHLAMEFMKHKYEFPATHVPYRSSPQSITDVVGGHVKASIAEMGASLALIRDGKLKALAVTSLSRLSSLPDVPTIAEAANTPGYEAVSWHVLLAPAATPRSVVDKLHAEMKRITGTKEFKSKATDIGLLPVDTQSVDELRDYIRAERAKWSGVVKSLGLEGSQ